MTPKPSLLAELKRRNVWRAAALYIGAIWALAQGIASLGPALGVPEWGTRWFVIAGGIGFPFWVAFAWFYEWTPEGFKREREVEPGESITHRTGRKLDFIIIGVLAVAIVLLLTDRFVLRRGVNQQPAVAISEKSIAVLPFVNMSSDKEQEYFSDGISEELLNLLAKIPQLRVAARTSSFSFKGKDVPIPEIAKTLGVAHVLEGSVRKSGDQVRITTQLIRAADGFHLWSETYDRKLDDIFRIQDEISATVVEQLKVTLLGAAPKARATDPEAYAAYLKAVQLGKRNTAEAFQQGEALLRKAVEIDPYYAPAWNELGRNFYSRAAVGLMPAREGYVRARELTERALAIDPDYANAHAQMGVIALDADNDLREAARHLERALELEPGNLLILRNGALLLSTLGRVDEAVAVDEAIVRRDPVNLSSYFNLGLYQRATGRFDAAIASLGTVRDLSPGHGNLHGALGVVLLMKGDVAGALTELELERVEPWRMCGLAMAYHALGRKADADAALQVLVEKYEREMAYNIAYVHAFRGDADQAFAWLGKAAEYGDAGLADLLIEPLFANIRSDSRWLPFLRQLGRAPEQLAGIEFEVELPPEWQAESEGVTAASGGKS